MGYFSGERADFISNCSYFLGLLLRNHVCTVQEVGPLLLYNTQFCALQEGLKERENAVPPVAMHADASTSHVDPSHSCRSRGKDNLVHKSVLPSRVTQSCAPYCCTTWFANQLANANEANIEQGLGLAQEEQGNEQGQEKELKQVSKVEHQMCDAGTSLYSQFVSRTLGRPIRFET